MSKMHEAMRKQHERNIANATPRDFVEDFAHENGNYQCRCYKCGEVFKGYKRRMFCKVCMNHFEELEKKA